MRTRADIITRIELPSGSVMVDGHGYLCDPGQWSVEFAEHAARAEGIGLTAAHLEVVKFMRAYLEDHGIMADARFVLKFLAQRDRLSKTGAKAVLFELFPYGYVRQACKIAGMRQPRAWSTG
ncbi:MAG: TusE/DsrC/DsvC family sulfur relay protein [Halocynthiibacter sp.]